MNIVFDLGQVLLGWDPKSIVKSCFAEPELQELVLSRVFGHPDWLEFDRGTLSEQRAVERFARNAQLSFVEVETLLDAARNSLTPIDYGFEIFELCKASQLPAYCISNMPVSTYEFLRRRYEFFSLFRGTVVSGAVGMLKPEEAIFSLAIARFGIDPGRTLYLDDRIENVVGARSVGMTALQFLPTREVVDQIKTVISSAESSYEPAP